MSYLEEVVGQINEQMAALIYQIGQQQPHLDLHRQAVEVMLRLSKLERIARSGGQRRVRKGRAEWMSEAQLQVLESMMRGEPYQSMISAKATRYFIDSIRTDFSRGYLERALRAAEPHLGQ